MKFPLQLVNKKKIAYDRETGINWTGKQVHWSEITGFVGRAVGDGQLEIVEDLLKKKIIKAAEK